LPPDASSGRSEPPPAAASTTPPSFASVVRRVKVSISHVEHRKTCSCDRAESFA
jgi:hypothetical protein